MRKSFDGLCGIVSSQLHRNPMSGEVFVFINKSRNRIKILRWEPGGFVLYHKRLESGTFELPAYNTSSNSYSMSWDVLVMMIEGIALKYIKKRRRFIEPKIAQTP